MRVPCRSSSTLSLSLPVIDGIVGWIAKLLHRIEKTLCNLFFLLIYSLGTHSLYSLRNPTWIGLIGTKPVPVLFVSDARLFPFLFSLLIFDANHYLYTTGAWELENGCGKSVRHSRPTIDRHTRTQIRKKNNGRLCSVLSCRLVVKSIAERTQSCYV